MTINWSNNPCIISNPEEQLSLWIAHKFLLLTAPIYPSDGRYPSISDFMPLTTISATSNN